MILAYFYSIISVLIVSAVSVVGIFAVSMQETLFKRYLSLFVGLAVGALLGDAFIHIIPETYEKFSDPTLASLAIILGIFIFFFIERIMHWHHHHDHENIRNDNVHPVGKMIILSDGIHNLIDGLIIGSSYLVSVELGIATTVAVILHEIPQEIGDFGVLLHAGYTKRRAIWLNFLSALIAVVGVFLALAIGGATETFALWLATIAGGGFIYIALSDLIPELHKTKKDSYIFLQLAAVVIGVLAMLALSLFE